MISKAFIPFILSLLMIPACSPTELVVHKSIINTENAGMLDTNPEFPGGWEEFERYISKNLKFPESERRKGVRGEVKVSFVIRNTGEITDVYIEQEVSEGLDREAYRLISEMPAWVPATKDGQPVSVRMSIPIKFSQ